MIDNQSVKSKNIKIRVTCILIMALFLTGGLVKLGIWQIHRLAWKQDLIARVEQNIHAQAISAPDIAQWQKADQKAMEYRHITVAGHYLNNKEIAVGALTEKGSGYWIITPLQRDNGEIIFINRGFVSTAQKGPAQRKSGQIEGETRVTGLLRLTEPKGFFLRQNEPEKNIWYARDIEAFAKQMNIHNTPLYFIDADKAENRKDRPEGGLTVVKFANNHLSYAITWFLLAVMVLVMAVFLIRYELKDR